MSQATSARPAHAGAAGGGVDIADMIAKHQGPCAALYYAFEECLGAHERNFAACQADVKKLRECTAAAAGVGGRPEPGKR